MRDYERLSGTTRGYERLWETMRDYKRLWETIRDYQRLWETIRDYYRDYKRLWETMRDYERLIMTTVVHCAYIIVFIYLCIYFYLYIFGVCNTKTLPKVWMILVWQNYSYSFAKFPKFSLTNLSCCMVVMIRCWLLCMLNNCYIYIGDIDIC